MDTVRFSPALPQSPAPSITSSLAAARRAIARAHTALDRCRGMLDGPHDFEVDLDVVNQWNAIAADADRVELIDDGLDFEALLDAAERAGWEGSDLRIPAGLTASQAFTYAETHRDGRRQRERDEEWRWQDRFGRGVVLA